MRKVNGIILALVCISLLYSQAHAFGWASSGTTAKSAARVIAQSAAPVNVGGTLSETTLMAVTLPALRANDAVRVNYIISYPGTTNTKTIRPKLGSTTLYTSNRTTTATLDTQSITIFNRNATNSQVLSSSPGTQQTTNVITAAVDTSIPQVFSITGQTTLETGFAATSTTGSGTTVTVIKSSHGLNTGEYVQVSGATPAGYNTDPVQITVVDANTFTYSSTATGAVTVQPTIKRYSVLRLESCTVELLPGAN